MIIKIMIMKVSFILLLVFSSLNSFCQLSYIGPAEYIKQKKISKVTQRQINTKDSMPSSMEYYSNGLVKQRTHYVLKSRFEKIELDTNYKGDYVIYYSRSTYDEKGREKIEAASYTGLIDPFIMITEYLEPRNCDTIFSLACRDDIGKMVKSSYCQPRPADTVEIIPNKFAILSYNRDTLSYKYVYQHIDSDSIVYLNVVQNLQIEIYCVYKKNLLISAGNKMIKVNNGIKELVFRSDTKFDAEGYPVSGEYWHFSSNDMIKIEIICETYK